MSPTAIASAGACVHGKAPLRLDGVPATLLIPLCMRAVETLREHPIVRDPKAIEILGSLDYDFSHLRRLWMTQVDTAVRTEIFDEGVRGFLAAHPNPTVVTLGAGLDGRFWRLDDGRVEWFDLDLPEVIALRRRFYGESPRNRFLAKSILDFTWIDDVRPRTGGQVLILAEGVLHYFEESAVRRLFAEIAGRLPVRNCCFTPPRRTRCAVSLDRARSAISTRNSGGASRRAAMSSRGIRAMNSSPNGHSSIGIRPAGAGSDWQSTFPWSAGNSVPQ